MKGWSDIPLILGRLRPSKRLTSTQAISEQPCVEVPCGLSVSPSPDGRSPPYLFMKTDAYNLKHEHTRCIFIVLYEPIIQEH